MAGGAEGDRLVPPRPRDRTPPPSGEFRLHCVWGGYGPDEGCGNVADMDWHVNRWRQRLYCRKHRRQLRTRLWWGETTGFWYVPVGPRPGSPWRWKWRWRHVVVVEQELGRRLTRKERVVFRDRDRHNMARTNLRLVPTRYWDFSKSSWAKRQQAEAVENGG